MNVSIVPVSRIFKTYQGQIRIAELNNRNPVKRAQTQRDHVSISPEARAALASHGTKAQAVKAEVVEVEKVEAEKVEENVAQDSADESFTRTDFAE